MRANFTIAGSLCLVAALAVSPAARAEAPLSPEDQVLVSDALHDRSTPMKVRLQAALIAGRAGGPELVPPLLDALGDPEFPVRAAAAMALGQMGDARAADGLIGRLGDPERFVRDEATEALQNLVKRGYGRALQEQVHHWDPRTRAQVVQLGADLGPALGEGLLAQGLADSDPSVRAAAQSALSGWPPPQVYSFLSGALGSDSPRVRAAAAVELGNRKLSQAIPLLAKMLTGETETSETVEAARGALRGLADQIDPGRQLDLARKGNREERSEAMAVLAAIRAPEALDLLEAALDDADLGVRADAAIDLGVLGDVRATQKLAVLAGRPENAPIERVLQSSLRMLEQPAK